MAKFEKHAALTRHSTTWYWELSVVGSSNRITYHTLIIPLFPSWYSLTLSHSKISVAQRYKRNPNFQEKGTQQGIIVRSENIVPPFAL